MKEKALNMAKKSIAIESEAISDILNYLDINQFTKAVEILISSPNIITCGSGSTGIAAKKFAHSLRCIEQTASFLIPSEAIHGGLGLINKNDAVIIVSKGGKTAELLPVIKVSKEKNARIIAITENLESPLAEAAEVIVPLSIKRESDKFNVMATSSFVVIVAIFDAMLVAIMEETDYKLEQFATIHPGGAVGEELNS